MTTPLMRTLAIKLIKAYRYILSPLMGQQCRFYPSCSHYSEQAFEQYGFFKACWLTIRRLAKCAPWHPGGFDYLPEAESASPQTHCSHSGEPHSHNTLIERKTAAIR